MPEAGLFCPSPPKQYPNFVACSEALGRGEAENVYMIL